MTQAEVVGQLQLMGSSMSRSTLANIESGRRNIKASDLKALQKLFDVDYEEFLKIKRVKFFRSQDILTFTQMRVNIIIEKGCYR